MTREERVEADLALGNAAEQANEYVVTLLSERETRCLAEAANWYRSGADGEHRAMCYIATLNEVRAMREEHAFRIRQGMEARKQLYGVNEQATASV